MRLIDVEKVNLEPCKENTFISFDYASGYNDMLKQVLNAKCIDAVPVVRCKDCAHRECDGRDGRIVCGIDGMSHAKDWFCADALAAG